MFRNLRPVFGTLCMALVLFITACDQPANTGGTADDSLQPARGTGTNSLLNTNDLDRARDKLRQAATNAATHLGRGLERTGQEIQDATRNATNR